MCYGLLAIGLLIVDDIIFQDTTNQSLYYLALVPVFFFGYSFYELPVMYTISYVTVYGLYLSIDFITTSWFGLGSNDSARGICSLFDHSYLSV